MASNVLYSVGRSASGQVVTVDQAVKEETYFCPSCAERFVLRAGPRRRRHFAHKAGVGNCSLESVLHQAAKIAVHSALQARLQEQIPYVVTWTCDICRRNHTFDLVSGLATVKTEHQLGAVRPDVALLDAEGKVLRVVEIVVTHEPDEVAWDTYSANGISVFCVWVDGKGAVEFFQQLGTGLRCYKVSGLPCPAPKCPICGHVLMELKLVVVKNHRCWRCGKRMTVGSWESDGQYCWKWIRFLPREMLAFMRRHGLRLKYARSSLVRNPYWRQVCPHCGAMQGDNYIGVPAETDVYTAEQDIEEHSSGFLHCVQCDRIFSSCRQFSWKVL